MRIKVGSLVHRAYGQKNAFEVFRCNYGLNPEYAGKIDAGGLQITGVDAGGTARAVELRHHKFFVATLFLPQLSSSIEKPHPLIVAYLNAAKDFSVDTKEGKRVSPDNGLQTNPVLQAKAMG